MNKNILRLHPMLLTEDVILKVKASIQQVKYGIDSKLNIFKNCELYITGNMLFILHIETNNYMFISFDDIKSRGKIYYYITGISIHLDGAVFDIELEPSYYWDKLFHYAMYEYKRETGKKQLSEYLYKIRRV